MGLLNALLITLGVLIVIGIVTSIVKSVKRTAREVERGATESHILNHYEGLPYCGSHEEIELYIHSDKITLECKQRKYILKLEQIIQAEMRDDIKDFSGTAIRTSLVLYYQPSNPNLNLLSVHGDTSVIILQLMEAAKALGLVKTMKKLVAEKENDERQGVIEL